MPQSFAPLINSSTKILVIGTMPGIASLEAAEYYGHPRNAFWKIIASLFNDGVDFKDYDEKKACLLSQEIGLWDSLQSCSRKGSLDSDIKNARPNDFETLLKSYPVKKLVFNGNKAFEFFRRFHKEILESIDFEIMPSTSPANATISFDKKLALWKSVLLC